MQKLDHLGWVVCSWFEIEGYRFGVRSTSHAFGEWIDHALSAYRVDGPREEEDDPYWAVVVRDGPGDDDRVGKRFNILYRGTWDVVRSLDVRAVARAFLLEVETILFPTREDAIFLEAAAVRAPGGTLLVPYLMVPGLARAARRVQRADLVPPGAMTVAIDPGSGRLVPVPSGLELPDDLDERLDRVFPPDPGDPRAFVDEELAVGAVLTYGPLPEAGVVHGSRAETLLSLAPSVRNLARLGGRGVEGLARLVAAAHCYRATWGSTQQMLDALTRISDDVSTNGRTEDTPLRS